MITKRPWFGPKDYAGWGWRPVTWQGWLVTAAFIAVVGTAAAEFRFAITTLMVGVVSLAAFLVVVWLTGAKPGGPNSD